MSNKKDILTKTGCQYRAMNSLYEDTALTPRGVARATGFLDWASQPSSFKHYPDFLFRYAFGSVEALNLVELSRMVSSRAQIASKPYLKLRWVR